MYANLEVRQRRLSNPGVTTLHAWRIELDTEGRILVQLDAQDGEGKYAKPAGQRVLRAEDGPISVTARF